MINLAVRVTSARSSKTRSSSESMFHLSGVQPLYIRKEDVPKLSAAKHILLMKLFENNTIPHVHHQSEAMMKNK